jgi:hypothetical protein
MRYNFNRELIPAIAGTAAGWSYLEAGNVENSMIFAIVGLASYIFGCRKCMAEQEKDMEQVQTDIASEALYTRICECEDRIDRRIDDAESRLDTQVEVILDKMN